MFDSDRRAVRRNRKLMARASITLVRDVFHLEYRSASSTSTLPLRGVATRVQHCGDDNDVRFVRLSRHSLGTNVSPDFATDRNDQFGNGGVVGQHANLSVEASRLQVPL
jgi:hypothetical protein